MTDANANAPSPPPTPASGSTPAAAAAAPSGHVRLGSGAGRPMTRRDGALKVTGRAVYAADNRPAGMVHAALATSGVARGRVASLDVAAARAHPGVIAVMTPDNRPPLARDPDVRAGPFSWRIEALQNAEVRYVGQPIALVMAETLEAATEGARLLAPRYDALPARIGFEGGVAYQPQAVGIGRPPDTATGDMAAGRAAAARHVDSACETPMHYHNAMEPHAIVAHWEGDRLTLDMPSQAPHLARDAFASYFGVPPEDVVLRSPFIGGGFGSKAIVVGPQILAALAARVLGRPVKLVLRREQMFGPVRHRGATRQKIGLWMEGDGRLTAMTHHATATTSSFDEFIESAANASLNTYACPAISVSHDAVRVDVGAPGPMRAPGEATGSAALEIAMDEAAQACGLDPLEFRLRNYAQTDPASGMAFSSKALRDCYTLGAARLDRGARPQAPRMMRNAAGELVGWGVGTALFPCPMFRAEAAVTLHADGTAEAATAGVDMGQGAWTALAQIAAEGLGIDPAKLVLGAGDSRLPDGGIAGGSGHTATAGAALFDAGRNAIRQLAQIAAADPASPLFGAGNAGLEGRDGRLHHVGDRARGESYGAIMARAGLTRIEASGVGARDPAAAAQHAMFSHGAVFAEVTVDPDLLQMRVTRLVGAFAAGRIINPALARSQLMGGMIWGIGFALHEEGIHDRRTGRCVNGDLAGHHVPVNADAPMVEALLVDEEDRFAHALGVKGVGELGVTGTVGAIANAIWHATGVRARRFPIQIDALLAGA